MIQSGRGDEVSPAFSLSRLFSLPSVPPVPPLRHTVKPKITRISASFQAHDCRSLFSGRKSGYSYPRLPGHKLVKRTRKDEDNTRINGLFFEDFGRDNGNALCRLAGRADGWVNFDEKIGGSS